MNPTQYIHCGSCLRLHLPGPCPEVEHPRPQVGTDGAVAMSPGAAPTPFGKLLEEMGSRMTFIDDPKPAEPPGPCPECGKPQQLRQVRYEATGGSRYEQEAYCPPCDLCADIPASFRWARFGLPELPARVKRQGAIAEAQGAVRTRRVVLVGPAGHGKTSLLAAMCRARAEVAAQRNCFVLACRLGLARAQHGLGEGEAALVHRAIHAPILMLDDLGNEKNTQQNAVPDVLFERHAEGRPTWLTTAMSREAMAERYGDGLARRVYEGAKIIDCGVGS